MGRSKLIWIINGNEHNSEKWKFLNDLGKRYSASRTFKEYRHDTTTANKYKKKQEVKDISHQALGDTMEED